MKKLCLILSICIVLLLNISAFSSADSKNTNKDKPVYKPYIKDKLLKLLEDFAKQVKEKEDEETNKIKKQWEDYEQKKKDNRTVLRMEVENIQIPSSTSEFNAPFHFPPTHQDYTGNCWSFSMISFLESEVYRLTKQKIKLSELYIVYWEYVEKAIGFVEKRGYSNFGEGSEADAVLIILNKYGIVPKSIWDGHTKSDYVFENEQRYDARKMFDEMNSYLHMVKEKNYWHKDVVVGHIKNILDKYLGGPPPREFNYEGKSYSPSTFLRDSLKIVPQDYYCVMSTLKTPFWQTDVLDVWDNWRLTNTYINLPLDVWYGAIKKACEKDYSAAIGGDTSEPGHYGDYDIGVIPSFDIPQEYIDQDSREYRIYNNSTSDDHGLHVVGKITYAEHDWYLVKDSGRSGTLGKFSGYYFFRDDFIKLKMLTILVHKDILKDLLPKIKFNKQDEKK